MLDEHFLTAAEYAARRRVTPEALVMERRRGSGPAYLRVGQRVLYPASAVADYEKRCRIVPANSGVGGADVTRLRVGPQRLGPKTSPKREAELVRKAVSRGATEAQRWREGVARADRLDLAALAAVRAGRQA